MSQQVVLDFKQKPGAGELEEWNKPIGGEKVVDYAWTSADGQVWKVKLPYWVKFAIDVDYVRPGYALQDYLNGAINGFPQRPGDPDDVKKAGFNLVAVCNEMGLGKSNLCLQFGGQVYGEEHADEWYPDWDLVLKYKILRRDQIIPLWKQARELGRIKYLDILQGAVVRGPPPIYQATKGDKPDTTPGSQLLRVSPQPERRD
jgi:hypothetical protein